MWTNDIESIVYTRIKIALSGKLKTKYKDLSFTNTDIVPQNPKFPTVYIHELNGYEKANDLENEEIHAVESSFQIEVTDNVSQARAKEVMNEVVKVMKKMKFSGTNMPEFQNIDGYFRNVFRCRRTIGKDDVL